MGANNSSRRTRVTNIENQNPIGVIDVSDDVVQRLKIGLTKENLQNNSSKLTESKPIEESSKILNTNNSKIGYTEQSISALEIHRQKELELQQNDAYWRNRMSQLEQILNNTNQVMEKGYANALESVQTSFKSIVPVNQLPLCQDLKLQLITCFKQNPNQCLKCSNQVKAFSKCLNEKRILKLDEKLNEQNFSVDGSHIANAA